MSSPQPPAGSPGNPALAAGLGEAGRAHAVESFTAAGMAADYEALDAAVLGRA